MAKTCYIIGPIGEPNSEERKWADFVKSYIVTPVVTELGYEPPQRSDQDHAESVIMTGIVGQMFEADLVVADLTDGNPNAFYELGIRNGRRKPVIHLIKDDQRPPFDLAGNRAIFISRDHERVVSAKAEMKERIIAIEENPDQFYSHVEIYMLPKQLDALKTPGGADKNQIVYALMLLLKMAQHNDDQLTKVLGLLAEKSRGLRSSWADHFHVSDKAKAERQDKLTSVTTTPMEPLPSDS